LVLAERPKVPKHKNKKEAMRKRISKFERLGQAELLAAADIAAKRREAKRSYFNEIVMPRVRVLMANGKDFRTAVAHAKADIKLGLS
jgi:ATP phosphoribosyltransferase